MIGWIKDNLVGVSIITGCLASAWYVGSQEETYDAESLADADKSEWYGSTLILVADRDTSLEKISIEYSVDFDGGIDGADEYIEFSEYFKKGDIVSFHTEASLNWDGYYSEPLVCSGYFGGGFYDSDYPTEYWSVPNLDDWTIIDMITDPSDPAYGEEDEEPQLMHTPGGRVYEFTITGQGSGDSPAEAFKDFIITNQIGSSNNWEVERKSAEGGYSYGSTGDTLIHWEDYLGYSSPSMPPLDIHFGAEDEEAYCCICGVNFADIGEKYGHNPDPIDKFPNKCCGECNAMYVIPARLKQMGFSAEEANAALLAGSVDGEPAMFLFNKGTKDEFGFTPGRITTGQNIEDLRKVAGDTFENIGEDRINKGFKKYKNNVWKTKSPFNAEEFEAQSARSSRYNLNRFNKPKRQNRTGTGVKRKFWQDLFSKSAEFESPRGTLAGELDFVMAQMYEIEDMANPTEEDQRNYDNLETRYYELVGVMSAEQQLKGRVRTISGKPHVTRKLVKDKNITPAEAATRLKLEACSGCGTNKHYSAESKSMRCGCN